MRCNTGEETHREETHDLVNSESKTYWADWWEADEAGQAFSDVSGGRFSIYGPNILFCE